MTPSGPYRVVSASLYFLPVTMRVPLKFGDQTLTEVICARTEVTVENEDGVRGSGWGETPLSVGWVWPAPLPFAIRNDALQAFVREIAKAVGQFSATGHPMELGHQFLSEVLPSLQKSFNRDRERESELPYLAALVAFSPFDIAIHDACANAARIPAYDLYHREAFPRDLSDFLEPAQGSDISFSGRRLADFLTPAPDTQSLPVWHLVGGLDPLDEDDLTGDEPQDDYPILLRDWIRRDGLTCLKIKLRGNDLDWDIDRLIKVGHIAQEEGVIWLSADFNCAVQEASYVNEALDHLRDTHPRVYQQLLYVEQPFPHELEDHRIDVSSVSARKPLFLDESAHDWKLIRLGRELGWNGVALKTCKTQTGALLSLSWAKAHGMSLMVQDLTNPMLAIVPHVQLAAHAGTIMGVECNGMQFYPEASLPEETIHPGLYRRKNGRVDLSTLGKTGFGYRVEDIARDLPPAENL
ncbi:MAG: enolase C-terminal domain-like protein [Verrucomicrobiota bacterium]